MRMHLTEQNVFGIVGKDVTVLFDGSPSSQSHVTATETITRTQCSEDIYDSRFISLAVKIH